MTQLSFSRLWGSSMRGALGAEDETATENWTPFPTDEAAKQYRDEVYSSLKKAGFNVKRFTLRGQVRLYWSLGVPCGESCTVYYIELTNA